MADDTSPKPNALINNGAGQAFDLGTTFKAGEWQFWDFKQIYAAIVGAYAINGSGGQDLATSVSDPRSLWNAGNTFNYTEQVLLKGAEVLRQQAEALAGKDGPWKGPAATSFYTLMGNLAKKMEADGNAIAGNHHGQRDAATEPDIVARDDVPRMLVQNGNRLAHSIAEIRAIDSWYANQAKQMGAKTTAEGFVDISDPKWKILKQYMTEDMRKVMRELVSDYGVSVAAVAKPTYDEPFQLGNTDDELNRLRTLDPRDDNQIPDPFANWKPVPDPFANWKPTPDPFANWKPTPDPFTNWKPTPDPFADWKPAPDPFAGTGTGGLGSVQPFSGDSGLGTDGLGSVQPFSGDSGLGTDGLRLRPAVLGRLGIGYRRARLPSSSFRGLVVTFPPWTPFRRPAWTRCHWDPERSARYCHSLGWPVTGRRTPTDCPCPTTCPSVGLTPSPNR